MEVVLVHKITWIQQGEKETPDSVTALLRKEAITKMDNAIVLFDQASMHLQPHHYTQVSYGELLYQRRRILV